MNSSIRPDRQWQPMPSDDDTDFIDLKKIWLALWSRKWSIASLVIVVTMLATLAVMQMTPIYRATATMLIETKGNQLVAFQQVYDNTGQLNEYLQTQLGLIASRGVAERVVRELNLTEHPEFDPRQRSEPLVDVGGMVRRMRGMLLGEDLSESGEPLTQAEIMDIVTRDFQSRVNASVEGKSQMVAISVEMADRLTAAQAANALANSYIEASWKRRWKCPWPPLPG